MADKFLIHGAFIKCDKGQTPSQLIVTSNPGVLIQDFFAATENDKIPVTNIQTFGVCSITSGPCTPVPLVWLNTDPQVEICSQQVLLEKSCINCSAGGIIKPVESGQMPPCGGSMAPLSITNNNSNGSDNSFDPSLAFVGGAGFTSISAAEIAAAAGTAEATTAVAAVATTTEVATVAVVAETSAAVTVLEGTAATVGVLAADDITGVGVVDDVAIPFVIVGGLLIAGGIALWSLLDDDEPDTVTLPPSPIKIPRPVTNPPGEVETEPEPIPFLPPLPEEVPTESPEIDEPVDEPKPKPKPEPKPPPLPGPGLKPEDDDDTDDPCKPMPRPHLGGNKDHNQLADTYPPNRIAGMDWFLKGRNVPSGKNFDSYSTSGVLWEIKVWRYKFYRTDTKKFALAKAKAEIIEDKMIAASCAIPFSFGCTSKVLIADLRVKERIAPPIYSIILVRDDNV